MHLGVVGLGKMGVAIAGKLSASGHGVTGYDPLSDARAEAGRIGVKVQHTLPDAVASMPAPRVLWLMVPWNRVDEVLRSLLPHLATGDIIVDGGNSRYTDTQRRTAELRDRGVQLLDVGISGGPGGGEKGFSLMVGGERSAFARLEPLLQALSGPAGAYGYLGPSGAGHFSKMVHNGVEYGMMESLAEGVDVLAHGPYPKLDLAEVARVWTRGSVVRSYLVDLLADILKSERLEQVRGVAEATGEGEWTVETAKTHGIEVPAIHAAVARRNESQQQELFAAKVIALLRNRFGGHAVERRSRRR